VKVISRSRPHAPARAFGVAMPMACTLGVVLATLSLSGCSLFVPKLQAPSLSVVSVDLLKSDLWEQHLRVRMHVQNPNDRTLPVKGISYTMDVSGQEFASGESGASFVVPAHGEAEFDMSVTANMAGALFKILGSGNDPGGQIDYRIRGKVSLSEGLLRSIPFEQRGTFKLK
jgi:LEA14-like dessication related protein